MEIIFVGMDPVSSSFPPSSSNSSCNNRFKHKKEKELGYETLFPPYEPIHSYSIYYINQSTTQLELQYLLDIAQQTTDFIIDTESDYGTNSPALIQILFLKSSSESSPLLITEIKFLPYSLPIFVQFKKLFSYIFGVTSHLYSWGSLVGELKNFLPCHLFSLPLVSSVHDVQVIFKQWFNKWFLSIPSSFLDNTSEAVPDTIIVNAPIYDPMLFIPASIMNNIKITRNESWSLQDSIVYLFHQYLSKQDTLQTWSIGFDPRLSQNNFRSSIHHRQRLLKYACFDCLSLAHIISFMYDFYLNNVIFGVQCPPSMGEYFSSLDTPVASTLFKIDLSDDSSSDEEFVACLTAVHDLNERQQNRTHWHGIDQHFQEIDQYHQDLNQQQQANDSSFPEIHQHHQEIVEYQHLSEFEQGYQELNQQQPDQHHPEFMDYQQQNASHSPLSVQHHLEFDQHYQENVIPVDRVLLHSRVTRSTRARTYRNQKSSLRHRRNRYRFEVIRPVNHSIKHCKRILHSYAVAYVNVNIVKSTLYIGVKSHDFQEYYEQLLSHDLFL